MSVEVPVSTTTTSAAAPEPPTRSSRSIRDIRPVWFGIVVLAVLTVYFAHGGSSYLFTFNLCMLAVLGAVALNLLMGTAGLVSIGNPAFMAVGAYVSVAVMRHTSLPFPLDIFVAGLAAALAGVVIGLPALRLRGLHLFLATLAGFFIVIYIAHEYQYRTVGGGGFVYPSLYASKGIDAAQQYWAWTLLGIDTILLLVFSRLMHERSGRAWRVVREHELAAPALGIPVTNYKLKVFALTSAVIGIQGALIGHFTGYVVEERYTFAIAVAYVSMIMIGGRDSLLGAVIGAGLVTSLPILLPKFIGTFASASTANSKGAAIATIIYGALVVLFITLSPGGIVGLGRRLRTWLATRGASHAHR